jgi:hypothetical protein
MSRGLRMSQEQLDGITRKLTGIVKAAPRAVNSSLAPKPTKYRNKPTTDADGVKHASKRQALRYRDLGLLMKSGEIMMLAREVRFRLPGGVEYRADHVTATPRGLEIIAGLVEAGDVVIEDVKSTATQKNAVYRLKKKQVRECLGIEIKEVL